MTLNCEQLDEAVQWAISQGGTGPVADPAQSVQFLATHLRMNGLRGPELDAALHEISQAAHQAAERDEKGQL